MINWDNAPEGATHWNRFNGFYYKPNGDFTVAHTGFDGDDWQESLFTYSEIYVSQQFTPRPTAPTSHTMTPTHIEISTGKEWEMVYQSSDSCMLTDRNGSAYSLVARDLSQYFTPIGDDTREMTERERFDAVMTRSDWSGFDKDQRGVLWEMWKEARGLE